MDAASDVNTSIVVGFAGMTHLGIVSSASVAAKGFRTLCYDPNEELVERLTEGDLPVNEPDLDELVRSNGRRQTFTPDLARLSECDVVYISADVPTDDAGISNLGSIRNLINAVGKTIRSDALLVILCQVPPGFTRAISDVPHNRLYYQVETLVFGRAVTRALNPERTIVGCADPMAPLNSRFEAVLSSFECPVLQMRFESAELAKIAINCCLVSSISVANTLAEICEKIGAKWSEIVPALKLDARIGEFCYLTPGLGIAGGNLERDLATVIDLAERSDTNCDVVQAWLSNSRHRRSWAIQTIRSALLSECPDAKLAVWGLAYKENTHSTKNSPSLATLAAFPESRFYVHDPVVRAEEVSHGDIVQFADPLEALSDADALLILTPWPLYRCISAEDIARALRGRVVLDPYRVLAAKAANAAGLDYFTLGQPHELAMVRQ
jgi:UDPglucose 6-dehydrogenase